MAALWTFTWVALVLAAVLTTWALLGALGQWAFESGIMLAALVLLVRWFFDGDDGSPGSRRGDESLLEKNMCVTCTDSARAQNETPNPMPTTPSPTPFPSCPRCNVQPHALDVSSSRPAYMCGSCRVAVVASTWAEAATAWREWCARQALAQALDHQVGELRLANADLGSERDAALAHLSKATDRIANLEETLVKVQTAAGLTAGTVCSLDSYIGTLTEEKRRADVTITMLRGELDTAAGLREDLVRERARVASLLMELERADGDRRQLEAAWKAAEQAAASAAETQHRLSNLSIDYVHMRAERDGTKIAAHEVQAWSEKLAAKIANVTAELDTERAAASELRQEVNKLRQARAGGVRLTMRCIGLDLDAYGDDLVAKFLVEGGESPGWTLTGKQRVKFLVPDNIVSLGDELNLDIWREGGWSLVPVEAPAGEPSVAERCGRDAADARARVPADATARPDNYMEQECRRADLPPRSPLELSEASPLVSETLSGSSDVRPAEVVTYG